MADRTMATGFTTETLEELLRHSGAPAVRALAEHAFAEFEVMPMPSPETEEWRYTDLREMDLSVYAPIKEEPASETLDGVDPRVLAAAGTVGERAGLSIQHNST